jgi:hypothetical protein
MAFLLKIAFYAGFSLTVLLALFFGLAYLFDAKPKSTHALVVFAVMAIAVLACLYQAFRFGHQQAQWGLGLALVVAAVAAWGVIALIGFATYRGPINWK